MDNLRNLPAFHWSYPKPGSAVVLVLLLCCLLLGCSVTSGLSESKAITDISTSGRKPMFKILDVYNLPESVNDLAWNAQSNKLVVGAWKVSQGNMFHYSNAHGAHDAFVAVLEIKGDALREIQQFKLNPLVRGTSVVAISPDDRYIAVGNTTVELFDLQENCSVWITDHGMDQKKEEDPSWKPEVPSQHASLAFSGDGRLHSLASRILRDKKNPNRYGAFYWGTFNLADGAYQSNFKVLSFIADERTVKMSDRWSLTAEMTTHEVIPRRVWIVVRKLATGTELSRLEPTRPPGSNLVPTALALSHDGRRLALGGQFKNKKTGATQNYLQIWDIKEQRLLHEYLDDGKGPLPTGSIIRSLDFSPDSRWLLMDHGQSQEATPDLHLFDVESGQRAWSSDHMIGYGTCRFSPSGEMFACIGYRKITLFKRSN